jgi:repressor LexA
MTKKIDIPSTLNRLRAFYRDHRRPPSFDEIKDLFGYKSKNAAFWLVKQLEKQGHLTKDSKGKLVLGAPAGIRVLGTVQAGFPSPAEEELIDILSLDEFLVNRPEQSFLIKVTGDSMIDAGIQEGDLVIVEKGKTPKNRDIVIAQVDGNWTMKHYDKTGSSIRLLAANSKYPPIIASGELILGGVVVAVIRKYR